MLTELLGSGQTQADQCKSIMNFFISIRKDFKIQPNTGYNLLIIGQMGSKSGSLALINPHPLPEPLRTDPDGLVNSEKSIFGALHEIGSNLSKLSPACTSAIKSQLSTLKL